MKNKKKIPYEIINKYILKKHGKKEAYAKVLHVSKRTIENYINKSLKDENGYIKVPEDLYDKMFSEMNITKDDFNNIFIVRYNEEKESIFKNILIKKLISLSEPLSDRKTVEDLLYELRKGNIKKNMYLDDAVKKVEKNEKNEDSPIQLKKLRYPDYNFDFDYYLDFNPTGEIELTELKNNNVHITILDDE